jgi:hypothetical protein
MMKPITFENVLFRIPLLIVCAFCFALAFIQYIFIVPTDPCKWILWAVVIVESFLGIIALLFAFHNPKRRRS